MFNQNPYNMTFHCAPNFAVPPPPFPQRQLSDHEFVKSFERFLRPTLIHNLTNNIKVSVFHDTIRSAVNSLDKLSEQSLLLENNINTMSDEEWMTKVNTMRNYKNVIEDSMKRIRDTYLVAKKSIEKVKAKRMRLKRRKERNKKEKEERLKNWAERSRKIDDNLQKIKDDIDKAKQEEEAKIQADIVLKEVLKKKADAKKCIAKLEALVKLRRARQNTAKGRGTDVSERDGESFEKNIDKLKALWRHKLAAYAEEEASLRSQLKEDNDVTSSIAIETELKILQNLSEWQNCMFGGRLPQRDFAGDVSGFIRVRSQWDSFVSSDGAGLPVGWVTPTDKT